MQQLIEGALDIELPLLLEEWGPKELVLFVGTHTFQGRGALLDAIGDRVAAVMQTPPGLLQLADVRTSAQNAAPASAVVAIGGGRVIDHAKAWSYFHRQQPVISCAVPTTAGSGSEATQFAVLYDGLKKLSLDASSLLPQKVLLDGSLLTGLAPRQRAISGLDALVQCLEACWSKRRTEAATAEARAAATWIWRHLAAFVHGGDQHMALEALRAANGSGRAIQQTRTTGVHALSYFLTATQDIPHGHAVAMLLPVFLRYNAGAPGFKTVLNLLGAQDADDAVSRWHGFLKSLNMEQTLGQRRIPTAIVPEWLHQVNEERFANNPVPFQEARLAELLRAQLF